MTACSRIDDSPISFIRIARRAPSRDRSARDLREQPTMVPFRRDGRQCRCTELARLYAAGDVDFNQASTFNLDEFVGLSADDPRGYRAFMERQLFGRVNLHPRRIHFLNGLAPDTAVECTRYERQIARAGGLDLLILRTGRQRAHRLQ